MYSSIVKNVVVEHPIKATAVEWRQAIGKGVTGSHLVNAMDEDGERVDLVIKFREPSTPIGDGHYGRTSLACELICSMLARTLGLSVPDYYVVKISDQFVSSIPRDHIRLFSRNKGLVFGTLKLSESYADWTGSSTAGNEDLLNQFEETICFDSAVYNGDRKEGNPNLLWNGDSQTAMIDHALALAPVYNNNGNSPTPSQPFPKGQIKKHCTVRSLQSDKTTVRNYENLYDRWETIIGESDLNKIFESIPDGWERQYSGDLNQIFGFLKKRPSSFKPTAQKIREVVR